MDRFAQVPETADTRSVRAFYSSPAVVLFDDIYCRYTFCRDCNDAMSNKQCRNCSTRLVITGTTVSASFPAL